MKQENLFNDVKDDAYRAFLRAEVIANMIKGSTDAKGLCSPQAAHAAFTYFQRIPSGERAAVYDQLTIAINLNSTKV